MAGSRPTRAEPGFTLLEVLVALAILALAIATLLQLSARSLRLLGLSGEHQGAVLLADRVIRERPVEAEEAQSGEEGPYRWERRVAAVAVPAEQDPPGAPVPRLLSVTVSVSWAGGRTVELATLRSLVEPRGAQSR